MAKESIIHKKERAELYYRAGMTEAKQLAAKVGTTEKTMGKWIKAGNWEKYRLAIPLVKTEQIQLMMSELSALNASIKLKPEGMRFASSKEADIRRKLTADLEALENKTTLQDIIFVGMAFTKWLTKIDIAKAQEVGLLFDVFIKDSGSAA